MNLILFELNEVNFDIVRKYIRQGYALPAFQEMLNKGVKETKAESKYELLEPWIQWPSVHTGKTYEAHKVFRLGDMVNSSHEQIFEKLEKSGFSVGALSPMNAKNAMKSPKFFIPDPWTQTSTDGSSISNAIYSAITQAVNDNSSGKLKIKTLFQLGISSLILINPIRLFKLFIYMTSVFGKPWRKAILLDKLLYEMYRSLYRKNKPNFSALFLNGCAHIQHHYFFNSKVLDKDTPRNPPWYVHNKYDPLYEVLKSYDKIISDLFKIKDIEIIIATGLSQVPYDKIKFYYRLLDHEKFLKKVGISFKKVYPRMTRDFLIEFKTNDEASRCHQILSALKINEKNVIFNQIENRGKELFVTLTYPDEISKTDYILLEGRKINIYDLVVFVAIKNGMHG